MLKGTFPGLGGYVGQQHPPLLAGNNGREMGKFPTTRSGGISPRLGDGFSGRVGGRGQSWGLDGLTVKPWARCDPRPFPSLPPTEFMHFFAYRRIATLALPPGMPYV